MKLKLPNISNTNNSTCQTEGNVPLNINKFHNLYKKYRIKNKVIITDRKKNDPNNIRQTHCYLYIFTKK